MKHAVGELKARLPPWHIGRVKDAGDMQLRADAADQRFGKWQGWKVLREFTTRLREDASTARFYDASYVFRNVVKGGRIVHVEIFAHWRVDQGKDKTFERQVDLLLSGLRF